MPRIGFVAVEPMQVLSLSAFTAFQAANALAGEQHYQLRLVSETGGMVMTSAGFRVETEPLGDRAEASNDCRWWSSLLRLS